MSKAYWQVSRVVVNRRSSPARESMAYIIELIQVDMTSEPGANVENASLMHFRFPPSGLSQATPMSLPLPWTINQEEENQRRKKNERKEPSQDERGYGPWRKRFVSGQN
jgi:hypothetical protein